MNLNKLALSTDTCWNSWVVLLLKLSNLSAFYVLLQLHRNTHNTDQVSNGKDFILNSFQSNIITILAHVAPALVQSVMIAPSAQREGAFESGQIRTFTSPCLGPKQLGSWTLNLQAQSKTLKLKEVQLLFLPQEVNPDLYHSSKRVCRCQRLSVMTAMASWSSLGNGQQASPPL